jgi:hypothetical protein
MANYSIASPAEFDAPPHHGSLLEQVHLLYRQRFRTWFAIMAPTSLLSATVFLLADDRLKTIFRSIPRGTIQYHWSEIAEATALRFGTFFLMWFLGCFALAATATIVNGLDDEDNDAVWRHDSYQRARAHIGPLVLTALITFGAFLVVMFLAGFVIMALGRVVGWQRFAPFSYFTGIIIYVVAASIISWLGAAIPVILKGNIGVWRALETSVELSSGHERALFLLVVESVLGSFLIWYAVSHSFSMLFPHALRHTLWYGWGLNLIGVLASTAIEPPLFIGFSLLAEPKKLVPSFPGSQEAAHIE